MRDDCAILHIDIHVTIYNFYAIYDLAVEDMGNTSGFVGVRVLAQGKSCKTVMSGDLIFEERFDKAPSNLIRVFVKVMILCRSGVARHVRSVMVERAKSRGLATRVGPKDKNGAQDDDNGQRVHKAAHELSR